MNCLGLSIAAITLLFLAGCQPSAIGEGETNKAFPKQNQSELESQLAKEGKLEEYKAAQERDRQYEQQGQQGGSQPPPPDSAGSAPR